MTYSNDVKKQLRMALLAQRRKFNEENIGLKSNNMAKFLCNWPYYQQSKIIMLFLPMADEPQLVQVIEHAWRQGKTVCVPHMRQEFGLMDAAIIDSMDGLVRGRFNLLVPNPAIINLVNPELIDLIVVPAVAYDYDGNRLGMGAGYYDRFITQASQAVLIGAIWSSHIIDSVPVNYYDKPVHYLLKEDGIIHCREGKD